MHFQSVQQKRLHYSLEGIIEVLDRTTAIAINKEADAPAAKVGAFGYSGHALLVSEIVEREVNAALPKIFTAYNMERESLWFDHHSLDGTVRQAVGKFYEDAGRHGPDPKSMWGHDRSSFDDAIAEARAHMELRLEEHFRHPGLRAFHERHAVAIAASTTILGAVLGAVTTKLVGG